MMRALVRSLKKIAAAEAGVAAVEFSLVAPIFFALLIGITDLGRYVWTVNTMQFAVDDAIRTGVVQKLSDSQIRQQVEGALATVQNGTMAVAVESGSNDVSVTATGTYSFMFPISVFVSTAQVNIRSEMPM